MQVIQCVNNHFFDADTYKKCPHCGAKAKKADLPSPSPVSSAPAMQVNQRPAMVQNQNMVNTPNPSSGETCKKCGEPIEPGSKFCSKCGTPVSFLMDDDTQTVLLTPIDRKPPQRPQPVQQVSPIQQQVSPMQQNPVQGFRPQAAAPVPPINPAAQNMQPQNIQPMASSMQQNPVQGFQPQAAAPVPPVNPVAQNIQPQNVQPAASPMQQNPVQGFQPQAAAPVQPVSPMGQGIPSQVSDISRPEEPKSEKSSNDSDIWDIISKKAEEQVSEEAKENPETQGNPEQNEQPASDREDIGKTVAPKAPLKEDISGAVPPVNAVEQEEKTQPQPVQSPTEQNTRPQQVPPMAVNPMPQQPMAQQQMPQQPMPQQSMPQQSVPQQSVPQQQMPQQQPIPQRPIPQPVSQVQQPHQAPVNKQSMANFVVGWLVCVKGKMIGHSFTIVSGKNSLGSAPDNKIVISGDESILPFRHTWIAFDMNKNFFVLPGEKEVFVNGFLVNKNKYIKARDIIGIGDGEYMLVPLCDNVFDWKSYVGN